MRICSDQPCIVLLTEKDVWIRVNGKEPISLKANHMALLNCENNIIDVSSLNNTLVAHISHDIIKDYLRFLNKDLSQIPVWQRSATPILTLPCLTPDVFRVAAQHSMMPAETESEKERTRALLFTVLSRFLDSKKFLSLMMYMLRNCVSDSVYQIIESDIHKDWNLSGFAPIFPDICYHLTHYKPAAADIPVASDNPAHYADAIRYNARTPLQGSLLPLTRLVWA